ncbi:hypothetical protein [Flavobacterium cellulosilyticum]|uniref:Uncharacterized protein n=1 Tax=Flavobacterium cellulosilyticum TaxID=2541731 RepID=A0A4R5CLD1_9FLAO|nr:hypothetical protein [Flavobacterium cellulosilyticum]TDD99193.1 hypothetical protein E0F76_00245 [Flavobacterium cellulosilyticum]
MKTLKYYTNKFLFFTNLKTRPTKVTDYSAELTNPRFEMDLKKASINKKGMNSLLSQMYSEENNALFI